MNAQSILRDIRRNREVQLKEEMFLPTGLVSTEQHVQILLVDPPFKIDIVSLMKMWGDNYRKGNEKKITLFVVVKDQWVEAGKDDDEKKNRKNGIQSLIHSKILQTCNAYDAEMTVFEFVQYNGLYQVKKIISRLPDISKCTKKAYQVLYGSLVKYMATFMYGSYPRAKKGRFLKKGIRALELSEAAAIFDVLEKKALKSSRGIAMRDLLILRLILYAGEGVEIKSILCLTRVDVDFDENIIRVEGKDVKCSSDYIKLLRSYLGRRKQKLFVKMDEALVQQDHINKRLLRTLEELGIPDATPRSIQRSLKYILKCQGLIQ